MILQSSFEGGKLVIRHGGEEETYDFASDAADNVHFIAFYGDCEHGIHL